ncbi:hypothetical protein OG530_25630 [Streptomyces decoyicus]|uniref:hypothetical protein n=1 Tax=Streptomyces decoyicus TaxID=249567 RepID=UPI002E16D7FA
MSMELSARRNSFRLAATAAVAALAVLTPATGASAAPGAPHAPVAEAKAGKGTYLRTVPLADGVSVGKIYQLGEHHFRLEGFADGYSFGAIEAGPGKPYVAGNNNGLITLLDNDGNVVSWMQGYLRGSGSHTEKLVDGETVAKVSALGPQRHRAVFSRGGRVLGSVVADAGSGDPYGALKLGPVWVVLDPDGGVTSYQEPAHADRCTVTTFVPVDPDKGTRVQLTNRPVPASGPDGPQALLTDKYGTVVDGVNFNHPDSVDGRLKMTGGRSGHPQLLEPVAAAFPKLPKGCPTGV